MRIVPASNFLKALNAIEKNNLTKPCEEPVICLYESTNSNSQAGLYLLKKHYERLEKDSNCGILERDLEAVKLQYATKGKINCQYCDHEVLLEKISWDHFVPYYLGGKDSFNNVRLCCSACNSMKGSIHPYKTPTAWRLFQENIKIKRWIPAKEILEETQNEKVSPEEARLLKKLYEKEIKWRADYKVKKDKKSLELTKEAC